VVCADRNKAVAGDAARLEQVKSQFADRAVLDRAIEHTVADPHGANAVLRNQTRARKLRSNSDFTSRLRI